MSLARSVAGPGPVGTPSVVRRLGVWIAAIASLAAVSILASITVAELSSGEARAINLAGSLRMQSYVIGAAAGRNDDPTHLATTLAEFDTRYRSADLIRVIPSRPDDPMRLAYAKVGETWQLRFRPVVERSIGGHSDDGEVRSATEDIVGQIDHLVALVEEGLEAKLQLLRIAQGISLILLLIVGASTVFQLKRHVVRPLEHLLTSARIVRRGDFGVRIPPREPDELGQLGEAFNYMVEDLSQLYAQLENRVQEKTEELALSNQSLRLLYRTTRALSEKTATRETLLQVLQEVDEVIGIRAVALCLKKADYTDIVPTDGTTAPAMLEALIQAAGNEADGQVRTHEDLAGHAPLISVPLFDGTLSHGAMLLAQPTGQSLAPWQIELLETVGRHVGAALATSQRNEEQHRLALLDERSVIARELHDSLAQSLSYLKIQVTRLQTMLGRAPTPEPVHDVVRELRDGLSEAYRQLRELLTTFRLRIDGRGLPAAIDDAVRDFHRRTGLTPLLDNRLGGIALPPSREIHVLQIIREALSNIERHARAAHVHIRLEHADESLLRVSIDDDGVGFDPQALPLHRYGLVIMRDRAQSLGGELTIAHREGGGTRVELSFPATIPANENPAPSQGKQP
ncbi:MAG: HAMP domain-containing protein [Proteobacteria bacterium]|nr:HAMP domain-containing protein [Pseudomonadota bacterium]